MCDVFSPRSQHFKAHMCLSMVSFDLDILSCFCKLDFTKDKECLYLFGIVVIFIKLEFIVAFLFSAS